MFRLIKKVFVMLLISIVSASYHTKCVSLACVSKTLTKHVSCECKCKFDGRKYNSNKKWDNDKSRCEFKKHHNVKRIIFGILLHAVVKMVNI